MEQILKVIETYKGIDKSTNLAKFHVLKSIEYAQIIDIDMKKENYQAITALG